MPTSDTQHEVECDCSLCCMIRMRFETMGLTKEEQQFAMSAASFLASILNANVEAFQDSWLELGTAHPLSRGMIAAFTALIVSYEERQIEADKTAGLPPSSMS